MAHWYKVHKIMKAKYQAKLFLTLKAFLVHVQVAPNHQKNYTVVELKVPVVRAEVLVVRAEVLVELMKEEVLTEERGAPPEVMLLQEKVLVL